MTGQRPDPGAGPEQPRGSGRPEGGTRPDGAPQRPGREKPAEPVPELSYEQARAELASVVERLEAGGCTLEEALALWERGEQLAAICQRWLDGARERLESARRGSSGPDDPRQPDRPR
ncbi:MAG: exodeoxyribonuclease VII small subunit [Micromonosporaceae bacterium]